MVLEDSHLNRLDQSTFPFVRDIPPELTSVRPGEKQQNLQPQSSLRSSRPAWHKAPSKLNYTEGRQRMIVFVAGGLTYSEIRCAYTVGQALGKEIFIGWSTVFNPSYYDPLNLLPTLIMLRILHLGVISSLLTMRLRLEPHHHPRTVHERPQIRRSRRYSRQSTFWPTDQPRSTPYESSTG